MTETAVDFLINKLDVNLDDKVISQVVDKAKEIEKEQIKMAYFNGSNDIDKHDAMILAEEYYDEFYNA